MQAAKPFVSTRIRFERLDFSDNLFSGEIGFSVVHSAYKGVSALRKGELHAFGTDGLLSNHCEHEQIKRTAEIMDSIADDQPKFGWEGYHLFDEVDFSIGLGLPARHETERFLRQIGLNSPVQIIDMILCPFHL